MSRTLILTMLFMVTWLPLAEADDASSSLRRFAYVIGANDGGSDRVTLRYADSDAKSFARLLSDLGGVSASDLVVVTSGSVAEIDRGFARLVPMLEKAREKSNVELLLYYSGHSDEQGLLLQGKRLSYKALREKIKSMPADVKIAILDSCASGAFTRTKGGKREPAFLVDESTKVEGYAFISSSSATEVAQESDRIRASFFTHYLVSGLRGGADSNRDGKVTLNEAYQFAFAETVARTESSIGGAQHPAYNMHLVGTGDVTVTDLRATSASLVVERAVRGRLFIRDKAGNLVVEVNKVSGNRWSWASVRAPTGSCSSRERSCFARRSSSARTGAVYCEHRRLNARRQRSPRRGATCSARGHPRANTSTNHSDSL